MAYQFFYGSIFIIWVVLTICARFKSITLANVLIGITTLSSSLLYEILLGEYSSLYYYIKPDKSVLYIVIAGILVYPALNIIYTLFLPQKIRPALVYTGLWTIAMLLFEYLSILTKTIVFTGWKMFPWSLITYILTYLWIYLFYRYLEKRIN